MKSYLFIIPLLLLFSCSNDPRKELIITFESSGGLRAGDRVILKEYTIGRVTGIELNDEYQTDIHIHLEKVDRLPKDSKFLIGTANIFSNAVYVIPGKSKKYLTRSDKIIGDESTDLQKPHLIDQFIDKVIAPKPTENEDSL